MKDNLRYRLSFAVSLFLLLFSTGLSAEVRAFDFMGLSLGMSQAETRSAISNSQALKIDDTRYLDLLSEAYPFTLKATYFPFIDEVYIDFFHGLSYQLTFQMNPVYFDYLTLADTLERKYGPPVQRTSRFVRWISDPNDASQLRLTLEYPSTVKIFDYNVMLELHTELSQLITVMTNDTVDRRLVREILSNF